MRRVVMVAVVLAGALSGCGGDDPPKPDPVPTASAPATQTPEPGSPSPTGTAAAPAPGAPAPGGMLPGSFQPIWPFAEAGQVRTWQRSFQASGTASWHLDAGQTALRFTREYLGFTEIDRVTSRKVSDRDAYIGVGYRTEGTNTATAAVLHLMRAGEGDDAPWEVVGSEDTTLQVRSPSYAAKATSPMTVGGIITGVDESLRVTVRQLGAAKPVGSHCCVMAGGQNSPWTAKVPFTPANNRVLTVIVSTGGHLQEIERFALTALRP
ncbi:hypothetical protein [Actinocorallia sp. A-T 12471]|uniref:hypothetical protein n=1 Tax=Actinocorallia sp. A-T 12471 TaxID=3089813 RepID=UPI0029CAFAEF|nr:hypothetical protein [Actinocorallia sp. A-T 12471]MDX6741177.1 hypothetical protein [Actinocorallia sp. A-T 12471]